MDRKYISQLVRVRNNPLWIILACSFGFSCHPGHKQLSAWKDFGLVPALSGRADITASIISANQILKDRGFQLTGDWTGRITNDSDVAVFFVRPEGLPDGTIARADAANRVIFVSSDWKVQSRKIFGDYNDSVATSMTLAIILLHETGHVVKFKAPINRFIKIDSLRLSHPGQMIYELYADIFAANAIKAYGLSLAKSLQNQLLMLDNTVAANYDFKYGHGATILSDMVIDHNKLYKDIGYDHPNLNLRFAFMDYFLSPSKEKMALIQYICQQRKLSYPVPGPFQYLKIIKDS